MHSFLQSSVDLPEDQYHLHIRPENSIGIAEVRNLQVFLSNKPPQGLHNSVIIHDAHLLTVPAQHALLKTLEEPPGESQVYIVTNYPDQLLPTILSRVLVNTTHEVPSENVETKGLVEKLLASQIGDRIKLLEGQKFTRQTLGDFLDQFELYLHKNIYNLEPKTYNLISDTRKYLKANCNLRLILTFLSTNLPMSSNKL